jgi:hypothetical protein
VYCLAFKILNSSALIAFTRKNAWDYWLKIQNFTDKILDGNNVVTKLLSGIKSY